MIDIREHGGSFGGGKFKKGSVLTGGNIFAVKNATFFTKDKKIWHIRHTGHDFFQELLYFESAKCIIVIDKSTTGTSVDNVRCIDLNGNTLWTYTFPSYMQDSAHITFDGNLFMKSSTGVLVKLNLNGTEVYNKQNVNFNTKTVKEDKDGNFIVANYQSGDATDNTIPALEKYDANLNLIWSRTGGDYDASLAYSKAGYHIILVDTDQYGGIIGRLRTSGFTNGSDYTTYFDSNGNVIWYKQESPWQQPGYQVFNTKISSHFVDRETGNVWIIYNSRVSNDIRAIEVYSKTGTLLKTFTAANIGAASYSEYEFQGVNIPNANKPQTLAIAFGTAYTNYRVVNINKNTFAIEVISPISSIGEFRTSSTLNGEGGSPYKNGRVGNNVVMDNKGDIYSSVKYYNTTSYYVLKQTGSDIAIIN